MNDLENLHLEGERAAFKQSGIRIENCRFDNGESPCKEGRDLEISSCLFDWYYPVWYNRNLKLHDCTFTVNARAALWYGEGMEIRDCVVAAPKTIRSSHGVTLENCVFHGAPETLWWNVGVKLINVKADGAEYFCLGCHDVEAVGLELEGKYTFDHCENVHVKNAKIQTKDVFWNCRHVVVEDSVIDSQYIGWNSEDITFIRCEIHSHQGFCYMKNIRLVACTVLDTDLAFEYCENIDADILTPISSIKNPLSGKIKVGKGTEIIFDDPDVDPTKTEIVLR